MGNTPKNVTIKGRLSWPVLTYDEAVARNSKSNYPKADLTQVSPEFNLLVEDVQLQKLITHIQDEFLPYVEEQMAKGEKRDSFPDKKQIAKVKAFIAAGDWSDNPPNMPFKIVHEKTAELVPEAVASVKVLGPKGRDLDLRATVYNEDQLRVPDPDLIQYPAQKKLSETVLDLYPGAYAAATLNLFAYFQSNAVWGISAGANVLFALGNLEGERLGGGLDVDEDAIFLDD